MPNYLEQYDEICSIDKADSLLEEVNFLLFWNEKDYIFGIDHTVFPNYR